MRLAGIPKINNNFKYEVMNMLLQSYSDVHLGDILMIQDSQGFDVLLLAIGYALKNIVQLLIQNRPHVDLVRFVTQARTSGLIPLKYAQNMYQKASGQDKENLKEIVRLLLRFLAEHKLLAS